MLEERNYKAWSKNIVYLVRQYAGGTRHRMSQELGIHHDTLKCWIVTEHVPTLPFALVIACAFDLDLVDLLSQPLVGAIPLVRSLNAPEVTSLFRRKLKRHDARLIEEILTEAVERPTDPPLSLMAVCKKAGCDQSYVSRRFPELAQKIIARRRTYVETHHVPTLASGLMVACAFDLDLVDLLSLPLAGEVHLVRSLKAPPVASLFRRKLKRHDARLIEDILAEAAEHPTHPPLSLMAVCKKAGCHQSYAARKFPELARRIIAHRQTYVRIHKQQREFFAGLITKSVASQLAASGQYPSHRKMSRALPSWISLREAAAKKAWLESLEEWGWKKGMNESAN